MCQSYKKSSAFLVCWNVKKASIANSVDPDQVCSGSTLFASILNLSVMLGNYLQQATSADDIFRCIFSWRFKGLTPHLVSVHVSQSCQISIIFFVWQNVGPNLDPNCLKRCFGRIFYHFTIFWLKKAKINFLRKKNKRLICSFHQIEIQVITDPSRRLEKHQKLEFLSCQIC